MNRFLTLLAALIILTGPQALGQSRSIENVGLGSISIIELGNNGDIWVGSVSQGVGFYKGSTQSWSYFNTSNSTKLKSDSVTSLTFSLVNGIQHAFVGTKSGLADIKAGLLDTIALPSSRRVLGVSLVGLADTLWVATDSGIVSYDTAGQVITTLTTTNSSIPFDHTNTSQKGGSQCRGIAVGTATHGFFYTKDYSTFVKVDTSGPGYHLVDNRVNTIYKENPCNRYVVGTKGGFSLCPEGVPCQNFTTANGLPQNDVTTIWEDCHGAIWLGMRDSGVAIFNNPTFTRITTANGLSDNRVTSISFNGPSCSAYIASADGNITIVDSTKNVVQVLNAVSDISTDQLAVSVYPQPASGTVNFVLGKELTSGELALTDLSGRTVESLSIKNATHTTADVSALPNGLYFYRISSDGQQLKTGKVQVMR